MAFHKPPIERLAYPDFNSKVPNLLRNSCLVATEMPKVQTQENPIHRPPLPTPDHNMTETKATTLLQSGPLRASSVIATLRRTVKVNTIARNKDVIFTQNAGW